MKKMFTFVVAAVLSLATIRAAENMINVPADSLETWFGDANWAPDNGGSATYDADKHAITVNIASDRSGQWHAQIKLHTGLTTLDASKQYEFSATFVANAAVGGVTAKVFDNGEALYYNPNIALEAETPLNIKASGLKAANSNGVIVFDFGSAKAGNIIEIKDIYFGESEIKLSSMADVMSAEKGAEVTMRAFDVVYVNGSNIYVKDETGAGLVYAANYGLKAGDYVAAGMAGTVDIYNGLYEIKPTSKFEDLTVTAGEVAKFATATALPSQENMNQVVVYKNVTFAAETKIDGTTRNATGTWKEQELAIYNQFKIEQTFEAGKAYNITAANAVYAKGENVTWQVYFLSAEEYEAPSLSKDTVDHGLYDSAKATITSTYFATGGNWNPDNESTAELIDGQVLINLVNGKEGQWQSQIFLNPGFVFEAGKEYKLEFDLETNNQLGGVVVKVGDADPSYYYSYPNDNVFLANKDTHYEASPINVTADIEEAKRLVIFSIGWCPAGTVVRIHNIRIVETGTYVPEEKHCYIKHPWGTGADADWSWQEMAEATYSVYDVYTYEGKWGGVGCNINDKAEDAGALWYPIDRMQFLSPEELVLPAPEVGTDVVFIYIPDLKDSQIIAPIKVVYAPTAMQDIRTEAKAVKVMMNGEVYILRDGVRYNTLGAVVK